MKIRFHKYHGTGNDFILVDDRERKLALSREEVERLCDRHFGIGADGLMLLFGKEGYDFGMTYFNRDGRESTMCGNGGRCLTAFARSLGIIRDRAFFHAIDGEHQAVILSREGPETRVKLGMKGARVEKTAEGHYFTDTGSPHYVILAKDIDSIDLIREARKIRYDTCYAEEGTNVDFVQVQGDRLYVRSYERGVEDETLSCGTGVTAAALTAAMALKDGAGMFHIRTRGGDLEVTFNRKGSSFSEIWLEGPARFVYQGEIDH
ncbi:MAG TPA: diaminopimelate epimerase [Bacteroidales bacterium]|nr:diaminopimelate epimerase [Bacteroidales bacterium]